MMTNPSATAVHVRRTIAAAPERVYRAWLDPELMRKWFAPVGFTVRKAEVDERVGGRLSIWHADGEGNDVGGSESEIVELVPGERIVLDWQFVGPDRTTDPADRHVHPHIGRHAAGPDPRSARRPPRPVPGHRGTCRAWVGVRARRARRGGLIRYEHAAFRSCGCRRR